MPTLPNTLENLYNRIQNGDGAAVSQFLNCVGPNLKIMVMCSLKHRDYNFPFSKYIHEVENQIRSQWETREFSFSRLCQLITNYLLERIKARLLDQEKVITPNLETILAGTSSQETTVLS